MTDSALYPPLQRTPARAPVKLATAGALALWFIAVFVLAAADFFYTLPGEAPLALLAAVLAPIAAFATAYRVSSAFRAMVLATDLRFALAVQAWRFAGLAFIALHVHGVLPGLFAWPAGLGDIAIGVTAPFLLTALARNPRFASSSTFVTWNVLGILDLVVAVGTGATSRILALDGQLSTGAMGQLPLSLIPTYFVPIFMMLHITALAQARRFARRAS